MTILAMILMTLGAVFLLVAAIGVIRLPDPLQRMHSATKAGTLGSALLLIGVMLSGTVQVGGTALLTIVFLLLTLPIGAQLLGRPLDELTLLRAGAAIEATCGLGTARPTGVAGIA